jgi:hypothetical protein|tara:strand:- start:30 stop:281 length:252 start_codon:yes stop_codon:yes gene_type:complete
MDKEKKIEYASRPQCPTCHCFTDQVQLCPFLDAPELSDIQLTGELPGLKTSGDWLCFYCDECGTFVKVTAFKDLIAVQEEADL